MHYVYEVDGNRVLNYFTLQYYSITIYDEASVVTDCTYYIVYHIVLLYKLWLLCDSIESQASQLF